MKFNLLLPLLFIAQVISSQALPVKSKDLKTLYGYMAGEFSSGAQATADSAFFHVMLRMAPIWKKSKDGYWLYVEQSIATAQDKPYRQRVYHLSLEDDTTIVSQVYELKNPLQYTGAWKDQTRLEVITRDSLINRQGCGIYLHKQADMSFRGSTRDNECLSAIRGAAYATSEVTILADKVLSWDRGWDTKGVQVWGAVKSGYVFVKTETYKL
ncbi:MAG TPA: chromophore lyase CpcT/CpeT [Saprospiraceae bacterium]|nr:chromophore lyase CpcT/CpeT [Saprospiraceae bacterium]